MASDTVFKIKQLNRYISDPDISVTKYDMQMPALLLCSDYGLETIENCHFLPEEILLNNEDIHKMPNNSFYLNMVHHDGKLHMYHKVLHDNYEGKKTTHNEKVYHMVSENGVEFETITSKPVLDYAGASHNFSIWIDNNPQSERYGRLQGIGGQFQCAGTSKTEHKNICGKEYDDVVVEVTCKDKVTGKVVTRPKRLLDATTSNDCCNNGIYLFHTENYTDWKLTQQNPLIGGYHPTKTPMCGMYGYSVFDSCMSLVFDNKQKHYRLYQRCNYARGSRYIMTTCSPDLQQWAPWELVCIDDMTPETANIYSPIVCRYYDLYLGFFPSNIIKGDHEVDYTIRICISQDGVHWEEINYFTPIGLKTVKRALIHKQMDYFPVIGQPFQSMDGVFMFLYAHNMRDQKLERHVLIRDRFQGIVTKRRQIATLITKPLIFGNELKVNAAVYKKGWLRVQLLDDNNQPISGYTLDDCIVIRRSDCIEKTVQWCGKEGNKETLPKNAHKIQCEFDNTRIYAFYGVERLS